MTNDKFDTVLRIALNALGGNDWPALPVPKAQTARDNLYQMEQTKWRKPEVIHHQCIQLNSPVAHASETMPFHRNRLDAADLAPHFDDLEDAWESLPRLTRCNLQGAEYAIHLDFAPEDLSSIFYIHTAGSAGKAMNEAFRER